jgi:hypothetical protein
VGTVCLNDTEPDIRAAGNPILTSSAMITLALPAGGKRMVSALDTGPALTLGRPATSALPRRTSAFWHDKPADVVTLLPTRRYRKKLFAVQRWYHAQAGTGAQFARISVRCRTSARSNDPC